MFRLWYRLLGVAFVCGIALSCKKDKGYSRFLTIKCNVKILPDTPIVKMGDTVRVTMWIPYNSYDYDSRTMVDVRDIQVRTWGGASFTKLDSSRGILGSIALIAPAINQYFTGKMIAGEYKNLSQNFQASYFEKRDTCFYFEMQLIPRTVGYYYLRPLAAGRGFMNNGSWSVDISSEIVNSTMNQYLKDEYYLPIVLSAYDNDYFFKTVP